MNLNKMKINNKFMYLSGVMLLILAAVLTVNSVFLSTPSLSEEQISELRAQYPVYWGAPPNVSMREPRINEIFDRADAVILGEVVEALPEYSIGFVEKGSNTPAEKIYEKFGMSTTDSFIQYRVKVNEVIAGNIFDGEEGSKRDIIIINNAMFKGFMPELKPGMKIVTPVGKGEDVHEGKYWFSRFGFYYVTEDGYVLSAYNEDEKYKFTGKTLDYLKAKITELSRR